MRGKLHIRQRLGHMRRITPAHAGKTVVPDARCEDARDHPRACGENIRGLALVDEPSASPPRMRGKHQLSFLNQL